MISSEPGRRLKIVEEISLGWGSVVNEWPDEDLDKNESEERDAKNKPQLGTNTSRSGDRNSGGLLIPRRGSHYTPPLMRGVQESVGDIDQEVDRDEADRNKEGDCLHQWEIPPPERLDKQLTDTWPGKDRFRDDRPAEENADQRA